MTALTRRAALFVLAVMLLATAMSPASARENEVFGLTPFPEESRGITRLGFEIPREPGAIFEDSVKIYNRTSATLPLNVYAADAETAADDSISVRFNAKEPVGVGSWIDLAREQVDLPPRGEVVVTFRIDVKSAKPSPNLGAIVAEHAGRGLASAQRLFLVVRTAPADATTTSVRVRPLMFRSPWVILAIVGLLVAIALVWIGTRRARRSKDVLVPAGELATDGHDPEPVAPVASRPVIKRLGEPNTAATAILERSTRPPPSSDVDDRPLLDDAFLVEVDPSDDAADYDDEDEDEDFEVDGGSPEDDDEVDLPPARHRPARARTRSTSRTSTTNQTRKAPARRTSTNKRKTSRPAAKKGSTKKKAPARKAAGKARASSQAAKSRSNAQTSKKSYIPLDDL